MSSQDSSTNSKTLISLKKALLLHCLYPTLSQFHHPISNWAIKQKLSRLKKRFLKPKHRNPKTQATTKRCWREKSKLWS
ncbi:unnamed protein product [Blepharisma stoltei]|uniref:Uncharacterized protein n=1 Tax=Blepharisma stoltei TaxID=1481888 RepID=A0AAU9IEP3_9CILI|nr:unnamed protein product [Blepharisma stoltei]